jgi:hypothetical protein
MVRVVGFIDPGTSLTRRRASFVEEAWPLLRITVTRERNGFPGTNMRERNGFSVETDTLERGGAGGCVGDDVGVDLI